MNPCTYGPLLEEWSPVKGFDGFYYISNYGKVISVRVRTNCITEVEVKTTKNTNGYLMFGIYINNFRKTILVHRMVAMCFIPNPENKPFANHNNCIKDDPFVLNLCWMTGSENTQHAWLNGMMKCTKHHRRSLTKDDVVKIRLMLKTGASLKSIADSFKVAPFAISKIRDNKTYKNII